VTKLKPRKVCDEAIDRMRKEHRPRLRTASIGSAREGTRR